MKTCIACSMPLMKDEDLGAETSDGPACIHCVNEKGEILSCEEIFKGGVAFFVSAGFGEDDKGLAEKLVRKNMKMLSYWKDKTCDCLDGEVATDEEFDAVVAKLSGAA